MLIGNFVFLAHCLPVASLCSFVMGTEIQQSLTLFISLIPVDVASVEIYLISLSPLPPLSSLSSPLLVIVQLLIYIPQTHHCTVCERALSAVTFVVVVV